MYENPTWSSLSLPARVVDGTTVVELRGEIDLLTTPSLTVRLDALTAGTCPDLVLDLRAVSFIDCAGLGVLCRARNRVLDRQGRLRLVSRNAYFLRVLRITGLAGAFEINPDLPAPLEANPVTVPAG
ncbi:anti-sigma factor antagonist [Streptomyces cyaneochromogenes]|uniref:Anti-sigma factor antagonist n=1 Tax=Streptomyces cyaneochromogenes TaxID=2496836 RepID=A0A3S9MJV8_9ACTN|nr:STAS domain-containing protein [Streptomyces cyaneochromogenes]AZQ39462.1 anti-sigma factor antagonist [Streptomyces cyaneochromogenes]